MYCHPLTSRFFRKEDRTGASASGRVTLGCMAPYGGGYPGVHTRLPPSEPNELGGGFAPCAPTPFSFAKRVGLGTWSRGAG